jgi:hypothetical protein
MNFYASLIIAFFLVVFPAYAKLRTDKGKPYFRELFFCVLMGALLSFYIGVNSHKDAIKNEQVALANDSLYKDLLKKNLKSAYKIIDTLDTAVSNSRMVLNRSLAILKVQNKAGSLLNKQLENTNKVAFELYKNTNLFTDFRMTLQISYDMTFVSVGRYDKFDEQITKTVDIFSFAAYRRSVDTLYSFDVEYDNDYKKSFETRKTKNVTLYLDDTKKIVKIKIVHPDFANDTGYEHFLPFPSAIKMKFHKKIYTDGTEAQNYNRNLPDLIMAVGKDDNDFPRIVCEEAVIDLKKMTVKEWFTAYMVREQDNHQIRSAADLNGCNMLFYGFLPAMPEYDYVRFDYGPQYSSYIDATKIFRDFYKFPFKNIEEMNNRLRF